MTHEELLAKIEDKKELCKYAGFSRDQVAAFSALRAVVELHKPIDNPNHPNVDEWCWQCADGRGYAKYPCPTIQAIEKELK